MDIYTMSQFSQLQPLSPFTQFTNIDCIQTKPKVAIVLHTLPINYQSLLFFIKRFALLPLVQ